MKRFDMCCPHCGKQITMAIAEKGDAVNGIKLDVIILDEAEDLQDVSLMPKVTNTINKRG